MGFDKASSVGRLIWRPTLWWIPGFNGQNIPGDPSSLSLMIVSTDERVSINGCVNDTKQNLINTCPLKPQVLKEQMQVDFIDVNMGCPIDLVYKKGQGSALMNRTNKLEQVTLNAALY